MKNLVLFLCFSSLALAHPGHDAPTPEEIEPQTRKLSPLSLSITGEMGKDVKVKVIRNGRAETLDLQVYNCRSKNFKVLGTTDEGGLEEIKAPPVCTYRGTIKDDPGSEVAGVITPEGVRMRVQCSNGECWQIDNTGGYHQWYPLTLQDRKHELEEICRVLENPSLLTTAFAVPREVTVKQAEIGFDIDYPTWSRSNSGGFNGNDAAAIARMEEFVAVKLNSFVISNALVEHVVGTIVIRKSAAQDPYDGMTNSSTILSHMRDVWNGWNNTGFPRPSTTHHLATALIGRSMGGIAGLGYVGTINENSRYTIGGTTSGSGVGFWFNGLAKHEVAHNWNLIHGGCGDEKRAGVGDDFTWSMCGGYHDRMHSDEAARVIGERDSSNLPDIGAYTANNQRPYCPKDAYNVSVGGAPILLDVLRNDYDANNDPIQIWRTRLISGGQVSTTELGGTMSISSGTGPGGRDQILYTPPANGTPGAVDRFYYDVEDDPSLGGALTNFGQVKVTLEPDVRPKEINPAAYLGDSAEEFSGEVNPVTEQIGQDAGGNDIFRDVWRYGFFNRGTHNFTTTTGQQTDSAVVVGAENSGWIGSGGSRIHKYAMLPGDSYDAAKRWTSNYTGPVVIIYDAARLDEGGNGSQLRVALNGANVWTQSINDSNRQRSGRIELEVEKGDTVDFVLDGLGSRTGDWTYWRARILKRTQAKWLDGGSPVAEYRLDIAGTYPAERRNLAIDGSGNDYHASLQGHDSSTAWISAEIENGLRFDGTDDQVNLPQPSELQGSSEFSVSVWVNAEDFTDNCAVLTSINDSDANLSYFGILMAAAADGSPVQFRAHRTAINAPGGSFELNRWIHIIGVWKAGETQKLYLDGVEVANNSNPPGGTIDIDRWVMGRDRAIENRFFTGTIDDLALFDRVLSPAEITAIYQQSRYKEFYDGVDDFKDEASPLPGNGAEEVTISAWVRASSLDDNRGIVTSYNSDDPNRSYFGLLVGPESAGRPAQFRAHRELVNALPGSFPIGEWSHIVGVWKAGEEQSLYIDGTKVAENNDPPSGSIDIERWITGRDRLINGRFFDGSISEQLIMPRAMNAGEVQELYEVGLLNYPATQGFIEQAGQIGTQSGSMEEASGILMTTTRGSGIGGTSDTFFFASRTHRGDGEVTVRLDGLNETGSGAKSGVMFRTSTEANSPFVYLWQYGDGRLGFRSRASAGATAQTLEQVTHPPTYPLWLRLSRQGNEFFATWSEDQETWQLLGTTTLVMPQDLEVGVAHQSHNSTVSIAHYGDLQLSNVVNTIPDSDLDGLVDAWEIANFGDLNQNASGDFDHDGINNLLERFYGTSPLIPDESPLAPTISRANGTFVSANSVWKYLDDGSNQGTAWREPGFDDSAWALGAQPLGYGEASLGTTVGHGDSIFNRHITTYFRRSFFVDDPNTFTGLNFTVTRDDGVVLYLNGAQKLRSNVPLNFDFQTPASFGVNGGAEGTPINVPVNTSDLVEGWNVLAAEVHQESNTSSDLFFTAEFTGTLPAGVPEGSHLSVKFPRSKDASDWNIIVEVTSDLATWSPVTSPVVVLEDLGATEMVQVFDSVPFNITDRRFIRIRVQAP